MATSSICNFSPILQFPHPLFFIEKYIQMLLSAIRANYEFQKKYSVPKLYEIEILMFKFYLFVTYNSFSKGQQFLVEEHIH